MRFSTKMVIASVTAVLAYTAALFLLALLNIAYQTDVWPPDSLTGCWYGFWTVELVSLATIKVSKVRNKYEDEGEEDAGRLDS